MPFKSPNTITAFSFLALLTIFTEYLLMYLYLSTTHPPPLIHLTVKTISFLSDIHVTTKNGGRALGRSFFHCPVNLKPSSIPLPHERWLFVGGLLPSGPRPLSTIKQQKPSFRKAPVATPSPWDGISLLSLRAEQGSKLLPLASPPAIDDFGLQVTPSHPG